VLTNILYFLCHCIPVRISAEFLWDFSLDDFLLDHSPNVVKIIDSSSQIPASLATQLDMLDTPPVRQDPLLKIAIFFSTDRESSPHRIEHKGVGVGWAISIQLFIRYSCPATRGWPGNCFMGRHICP
jgi:hypothetical protein